MREFGEDMCMSFGGEVYVAGTLTAHFLGSVSTGGA